MDRRLLPGAKLTEATLCAVFACSRATVRTALSQLAHDKIVVIEPNRGAFVWQPSAKETRDVFEMRQALESMTLDMRSEEHTSELQSLMSISYHVFCLQKKKY